MRYQVQSAFIYKAAPRSSNLTWSHYKHLLALKDDEAREFYEKEAARLEWTRDDLAQAIQKETFAADGKTKPRATALKRPTEPTYVYRADVLRVIDGDTLLLRIDLGFAVWKEQRLRLAELDTPAMDEQGGQEAYRFVRDQLA